MTQRLIHRFRRLNYKNNKILHKQLTTIPGVLVNGIPSFFLSVDYTEILSPF